jgi:hypothetical protein
MFYLIGPVVLLSVLAAGAFLLADIHHVNPLWVIASLISAGFFAGTREDYRKEFHSPVTSSSLIAGENSRLSNRISLYVRSRNLAN